MVSGNSFYFAWCNYGDPFDPTIHNVIDSRALSINLRHVEFARRNFSVDFPPDPDHDLLRDRQACHISVSINGEVKHLAYGIPVNITSGNVTGATTVEFEVTHPDDVQMQADLLSEVFSNPFLYIPQIEEASDALDAEVALKATTFQMEWDKDGIPYLCSIFGDPERLKIISGSRIPKDSFSPSFDRIPARGVSGRLTLNWTDYWAGDVDCSYAIQQEIDRVGSFYGYGPGEANFSFTPDFLDSLPQPGSSVGDSYVVTESGLASEFDLEPQPGNESTRLVYSDEGPAPKFVAIEQDNQVLSGVPSDGSEYSENRSIGQVSASYFSTPRLKLYGIRSRDRTEIINVFLPFRGQEVIKGNGDPLYLELSADGLHEDNTVEEHQTDFEYPVNSLASASGVVFSSNVNHRSRNGLLNDLNDYDPWSATRGERLWSPVFINNSPLRFANTSRAAASSFGRRCIQNLIRRMVAMIGLDSRVGSVPFDIPVEDAYDLDTGHTVRIVSRFAKGGFIEGKVSDISIFADGNGTARASIRIQSSVGSGELETDNFEDPEDDGDGEAGQTPGLEFRVATEGGKWDDVRYQSPIYFVQPLGSPQGDVSVKIDWLGCEQEFALSNPGQFIPDPYGKIRGPEGGFPARTVIYDDNATDSNGDPLGGDDWLSSFPTAMSYFIDEGDSDSARPVYLSVPITFGWRGPKQLEI